MSVLAACSDANTLLLQGLNFWKPIKMCLLWARSSASGCRPLPWVVSLSLLLSTWGGLCQDLGLPVEGGGSPAVCPPLSWSSSLLSVWPGCCCFLSYLLQLGDLRINSWMGRAAWGCPALTFSLTSGLEVGSPLWFCKTPELREKLRLPFHLPTKLPSLSVPLPTWLCLAVRFEMKYLSFGPQPLVSCRKQRASPGLLQGTSVCWGGAGASESQTQGGAEGRFFWPREEAPAPMGPPLRGRAFGLSPEETCSVGDVCLLPGCSRGKSPCRVNPP